MKEHWSTFYALQYASVEPETAAYGEPDEVAVRNHTSFYPSHGPKVSSVNLQMALPQQPEVCVIKKIDIVVATEFVL